MVLQIPKHGHITGKRRIAVASLSSRSPDQMPASYFFA
jgi:hypothetical protein